MKKRLTKTAFLVLAIISAALAFPLTAFADMGPKASVTITVNNPPTEPYYLDLLTQDSVSNPYDNIREARVKLDQNMLQQLYSGTDAGWRPAYAGGMSAPIFGSLTGTAKDGAMVHEFSYFGVPKTYRIIIVTQSGRVTVSDTLTRENLQSKITYDYGTGKVSEASFWPAVILQFISTLIPTLIIEGLLLLAFGFKLRDNYRVFLLTNLITQILLTLSAGYVQYKYGVIGLIFVFLFAEFFIMIAELVVYLFLLKGRSKGRRAAYAITANLVSCFVGLVVMAVTGLW